MFHLLKLYKHNMSYLPLFSCLVFLCFSAMIPKSLSKQKFQIAIDCSHETFTPNINLSKLLESHALNTTYHAYSTGLFSNIITGPDVDSNTTLYSQFFCQGDYSNDECKNCVENATRLLSMRCQTSISAHIWYKDCSFHYSNINFYNQSSSPTWFLKSNKRVLARDTAVLTAFVATTISELAKQVAISNNTDYMDNIEASFLGGRSKYFGTKVINFTTHSFGNRKHVTTLYEMVQCTPDLSVEDCNKCLTSMISQLSKCCKGRLGGRVATYNCFIRYDAYPFYNITPAMKPMEVSLPCLFTASPMTSNAENHPLGKISLKVLIAITVPAAVLLGLATFGIGLCVWKAKHNNNYSTFPTRDDDFDPVESLLFNLDELKAATQNFSDVNKIGHGGFGCVYKGTLQNGQEIAVKKLLRSSSQVEQEFKNEVELLAKLQHRNLVRLLGFCFGEGENMLVFEYVPNKSLDKLLFDTQERVQLSWLTRFKIIVGTARGLLYLHEETRHSIVHRDLKPGNILLDDQMNPKIADFGMARFFGLKQAEFEGATKARGTLNYSGIDPTHQSTHRGGGTIGYMAPEIAQRRKFSVKTDVYSYGVMILEIITGKRNTSFHRSGLAEDLLSYAWIQWKAGTPLALIDEALVSENEIPSEEMRDQALICIHLGLLCIQKDPKVRPTMRMVVQVFSNFKVEFEK